MHYDTSVSAILLFILFLIFSLSVHEATHAYVARSLGDTTAGDAGRITLNPLKHIDLYTTVLLPIITLLIVGAPLLVARPVPIDQDNLRFEEFGAALVAIAGPISNFLLAVAAISLFKVGIIGASLAPAVVLFMKLNIGLFVLNMLPIPPLDGSRLLYAFAPQPLQRIMEQLEQSGIAMIVLLVLLLSPVLSPLLLYLNQLLYGFLV